MTKSRPELEFLWHLAEDTPPAALIVETALGRALSFDECAYCGDRVPKITRDHVVPKLLGGSNNRRNMTQACRRCNSSKGARTPAGWVMSAAARLFAEDTFHALKDGNPCPDCPFDPTSVRSVAEWYGRTKLGVDQPGRFASVVCALTGWISEGAH